MYLIVGCSTSKEMWECLEEAYLQATKDKEFQLKQQLQTIHKPVDEDSKVINFARGLGLKYKTFRTVMLGRGFKPAGQETSSYNSRNGPGPQNSSSSGRHERNNTDACQICGRNKHTALKCFYRWDYSYQAAEKLPQALAATNLQNINDTLYVDSGASSHMTHNSGILTDLKHYNGLDKIIIGNRSKLHITHVGNISRSSLKLKEVLVVPKINKNLLSVSKLAKDNCCTLEFDETNFVVKEKKTRTLLAKGTKRNELYALEDNNLYGLTAAHDWNTSDNMWHTRLGHPSLKHMIILIQGKYRMLVHTILVKMLLQLTYSLMMKVLLNSQAQDQMLRNRLKVMLHTVVLKLQLQILDLLVSVRNRLHLQVQPNEHHQTTTLVDVPVDHQSDNATLQSTTLVDAPVEVLPPPQGHHMITRNKAKEHHLLLAAAQIF
ncbi:hypothetical protein KY284_020368 [Solanum tuberosum]|nr:hypothetical protein KY284_020368 [Solanum tuberosum]